MRFKLLSANDYSEFIYNENVKRNENILVVTKISDDLSDDGERLCELDVIINSIDDFLQLQECANKGMFTRARYPSYEIWEPPYDILVSIDDKEITIADNYLG